MLPVKAVLFDFDGTLVDSLPEIYGGVAKAVRSFGLEPPSKEEVAAMIGRGVTVLSERVCERLGRSDPAFSKGDARQDPRLLGRDERQADRVFPGRPRCGRRSARQGRENGASSPTSCAA
jgi:phosphoglycolate phosphatase-like HAD superfamily hydrolase